MIDVGISGFRSPKYCLLHNIRFHGIPMHGMIISKALGLQSGSQVVHNKSIPRFADGAIQAMLYWSAFTDWYIASL